MEKYNNDDPVLGGAQGERRRGGSVSDSIFMSFNGLDEDAFLSSTKSSTFAFNKQPLAQGVVGDDDDAVIKAQKDTPQYLTNPTAQLRLSAIHFLAVVLLGVGVVAGVLLIFLKGVTIKHDVADPIGSSKTADDEVEFYQTISGYLTAGFGMMMEAYFGIFLAVMLTYFGNIKLYPSDTPRHGQTKFKRTLLFCFTPVIIYVVNIGLSSLFIQHTTSGVQRVFVKQDLVATALATASRNSTSRGVENTILRSAVRKQVVPFEILSNSSCGARNATDFDPDSDPAILPAVKEIRSTAVVFGFPVQQWNYAVFPDALTPTHSIKFTMDQLSESAETIAKEFADFKQGAEFDFLTGYEMLLQGKTLLERSVSDSNATASYPCTLVDGRSQDDEVANRRRRRRRLQDATIEEVTEGSVDDETDAEDDLGESTPTSFQTFPSGENAGKRVCMGAISSLPDLVNMTDEASMHNLNAFAETIMNGMNKTLPLIAAEEIEIKLEKYRLSSQIKMTAMSIDIPLALDARYRDLLEFCTSNGTLKDSFIEEESDGESWSADDIAMLASVVCNQAFYPYDKPYSLCGSGNCIFLDKSGFLHLKKQILLMPYLKDCSVKDIQYNNDFLNFLPSGCKPQQDSVFLYGLGTYMTGDLFDYGIDEGVVPSLHNPRRHITLSFAKLEWELQDLSPAFDAKCIAPGGCDGLLHKLQNVTSPTSLISQALVLGKSSIPSEIMEKDFRNPIQLVTLNARPLYYPQYGKYFEWEYLNMKRFSESNWPKDYGLNESSCSILIDSYIRQVEANHYYLDEPLQAMYTSAMYYLFQDASVKQVTAPTKTPKGVSSFFLGAARLKGDRERKQIKFSIPLVSAIATFVGLVFLLICAAIVVVFPKERLKFTDEANAAARYVDVLTDDLYPAAVHDRKLVYSTGEEVQMDDYKVDGITFHHQRDHDKKVYM